MKENKEKIQQLYEDAFYLHLVHVGKLERRAYLQPPKNHKKK